MSTLENNVGQQHASSDPSSSVIQHEQQLCVRPQSESTREKSSDDNDIDGEACVPASSSSTLKGSREFLSTKNTSANPKRILVTHAIRSWKLEWLNCVLIIVAIFAIFATLYPHDGQRVPDWPFSITINALLSIYSLWYKASVLFVTVSALGQLQWSWYSSERPLIDIMRYSDAGSGPWGSFRLLIANKLKHPLAAFGAVIIITTIAVDPFTQQLISPIDCSYALDSDEATLPATTRFDGVLNMYQGPLTGAPFRSLASFPSSFIYAVQSGLHDSSHIPSFQCSTGNCTFADTYRTLGVCSACDEIGDQLTFTKVCLSDGPRKLTAGMDCKMTGQVGAMNLTTSLLMHEANVDPHNISIVYTEFKADRQPPGAVFTALSNRSYIEHSGGPIEIGSDFIVILGRTTQTNWRPFDAQRVLNCSDVSNENTWPCKGYGAARCKLRPCIREYNATIEAGKLTENLVSQTDLDQKWGIGPPEGEAGTVSDDASWLGLLDTSCVSVSQLESLEAAGYDTRDRWVPYDVDFPLNASSTPKDAPFPQSLLEAKCLYLFRRKFLVDLWADLLNQLLQGTVVVRQANRANHPNGGPSTPMPGEIGLSGPAQLVWLYDGGSVDLARVRDVAGRLADTLTLYVRAHGHPAYSDPARGRTLHYAVCIRVHWGWLVLPAVLGAATVAFLALVAAGCGCGGPAERGAPPPPPPLWKASPLAPLFHGPGGADWAVAGGETAARHDLSRVRGMERVAEETTVILDRDKGRLEVVRLPVRAGLPNTRASAHTGHSGWRILLRVFGKIKTIAE